MSAGARTSSRATRRLPASPRASLSRSADSCGRPSLGPALAALGARGLTSVLVEGGQAIATALLRHRLVDALTWYGTDAVVGSDGLAAIGVLRRTALTETTEFRTVRARRIGRDHVRFLERAP